MSVDPDGKPESHFYPFTKDGETVAWKERKLPKEFRTHGDFAGAELFGQNVASGKLLVVTEGELDAMAVAQAWHTKYNRFYAVVSLPNGVNSVKSLLINRDFIRSFETVVLMFDQDEVGKAAVDEAAKIVGMGRCKVAKLPAKDPCDVLKEFGADTLVKAVYNAQTWSPAGIVMGEAIWDQFMARKNTESLPYPDCLGGLNEKLGGIRAGEITLFTSGTGSGKSTVIKEIILDLLSKTDDKIGLISLEESVGDTAEKFISMSLGRATNGHPPLTDDELRRGFDSVFGDERLVLLDHQGSVSDASLIDKIEYLALMGCKYLVLDHITIAVSEGTDGLSGNEAIDKMMSDLLKIVKQHNVWLGLISHLRKSMHGKSFEEGHLASIDDIKGSGSIKQISFDIIAFARNLVAENEHERNQIKLRVLKSRFTGRTGDAGTAVYDPDTTRLSAGGGFEYKA
ncbi:MAG: toprim domain-containing protein [Chromatiales bacterium]|nr:toprim domain-containing protein [Chromatiales bacterium]